MHIEITEMQATALREILQAYDQSVREAEMQSPQTVLEVQEEPKNAGQEPWVVRLWGILIDRIPDHPKSIRRDEGTTGANWMLKVTPSDISNWTDVKQSAAQIRWALTEHDHARVDFHKVGDADHVIVYDLPRWS